MARTLAELFATTDTPTPRPVTVRPPTTVDVPNTLAGQSRLADQVGVDHIDITMARQIILNTPSKERAEELRHIGHTLRLALLRNSTSADLNRYGAPLLESIDATSTPERTAALTTAVQRILTGVTSKRFLTAYLDVGARNTASRTTVLATYPHSAIIICQGLTGRNDLTDFSTISSATARQLVRYVSKTRALTAAEHVAYVSHFRINPDVVTQEVLGSHFNELVAAQGHTNPGAPEWRWEAFSSVYQCVKSSDLRQQVVSRWHSKIVASAQQHNIAYAPEHLYEVAFADTSETPNAAQDDAFLTILATATPVVATNIATVMYACETRLTLEGTRQVLTLNPGLIGITLPWRNDERGRQAAETAAASLPPAATLIARRTDVSRFDVSRFGYSAELWLTHHHVSSPALLAWLLTMRGHIYRRDWLAGRYKANQPTAHLCTLMGAKLSAGINPGAYLNMMDRAAVDPAVMATIFGDIADLPNYLMTHHVSMPETAVAVAGAYVAAKTGRNDSDIWTELDATGRRLTGRYTFRALINEWRQPTS